MKSDMVKVKVKDLNEVIDEINNNTDAFTEALKLCATREELTITASNINKVLHALRKDVDKLLKLHEH